MDPKTTAIVLIEYQNDFTTVGGVFHDGVKAVVDNKAFRKGSWGAANVDVLKPHPEDILIEGKRGLDTFPSTNLDFILRSKQIQTVVLGGFLTNCCVESTMRSAYERGFGVVTLKDCTATLSQEAQTWRSPTTSECFRVP